MADSARKPASAAAAMPKTAASRMCIPTLWFIHHVTMAPRVTSSPWAKLDKSGRAVDQREPDGRDGDDQPELDPVGDRLRQLVPSTLGLAERLAEEVVEGLALVGAHVDDQLGLRLVTELDVVGQRVFVEQDGVGARPRQLDLELAVGVADGSADLGAAGVDAR